MDPEHFSFLLKIGIAAFAGLLIGLEREYKGKEAGLKTNALVSIGSAVFILISLQFRGEEYADITRVLSQVVTGIGFLGAGVIIKRENNIEGLTTAATVWCSAAVGCLAAVGMYIELGFLTLTIIIINLLFGFINSKMQISKEK
ncbi:MgtC/SapB family protein [Aureibaculum sp. 2210JD6-5]|uniref:MgtC/SapB family protein n=1 Tax=Aureibaculum sp. 2210JD6-5 TaxID=3103957 RepID=UPI002AAC8D0E|nr:MgtC/SapB family protein [Aureibaculum sp. 2210JD6-5]MDY7394966.1 MgtC/SapB family protein [Aureibaculum sp. 2210JD6-5]